MGGNFTPGRKVAPPPPPPPPAGPAGIRWNSAAKQETAVYRYSYLPDVPSWPKFITSYCTERIEGSYPFGVVGVFICVFVCVSVRPSVRPFRSFVRICTCKFVHVVVLAILFRVAAYGLLCIPLIPWV